MTTQTPRSTASVDTELQRLKKDLVEVSTIVYTTLNTRLQNIIDSFTAIETSLSPKPEK